MIQAHLSYKHISEPSVEVSCVRFLVALAIILKCVPLETIDDSDCSSVLGLNF